MSIPAVDPTTDGQGLIKGVIWRFGGSRTGRWYLRHIAPRVDPILLRRTNGRISSIGPWPRFLLMNHIGVNRESSAPLR